MNDTSNDTALFEGLQMLLADCGTSVNKHDQVKVLITACIERGLTTRPQIVGALRRLGFNPQHVAIILKEATGGNPELHLWQRDPQGQFTLHEKTDFLIPAE